MFGGYPCCDGALAITMPAKTPAYFRENCPHCGAVVWHLLSRIDPQSWTEADFLIEHEVDDATKQIRPKRPEPIERICTSCGIFPATEHGIECHGAGTIEWHLCRGCFESALKRITDEVERSILYGDPSILGTRNYDLAGDGTN